MRSGELLAVLVAPIAVVAVLRADTPAVTAMKIARGGHQATLLRDGRVLVSGGSDDSGNAIGPAEIFNPVTGAWSMAHANVVPRIGHAAVLLRDGRVLVAGGVPSASSCEAIASAELYDPSTDRWSLTASIPEPAGRGSVAVTLNDGAALIAGGGTSCGEGSASAALFDPSSNSWSQTAAMGVARRFHVATLLDDGRVLVSGGASTRAGIGAGAEVFDPKAAAWTLVVDGDARLVTGTACDGYLQTYASALGPDSLIARATPDDCSSVTVLPARRMLVAGGTFWSNTTRDSTQLSDLASGESLLSVPLRVARAGHTATRLSNGTVLIAGGRNSGAALAAAEIYIPPLPYTASLFVIPRGGLDRLGSSYSWGTALASSTNSHKHVLIAYRNGMPPEGRILEWDSGGSLPGQRFPGRFRYIREIGRGQEFHSIRIDQQDNIWAVSATIKEVIQFNAEGEVLLRFGRKPETDIPEPDPPETELSRPFLDNPSDLALDANGNVFIADNGQQPRIIKFDRRGRFLAATGGKGSRPGRLNLPHSLATDASGNVYVADAGNSRIQVFNNNLRAMAAYYGMGRPWAICITKGRQEYLYSASNPDQTDSRYNSANGDVYKVQLDGTILGKAVGDDISRGTFPTLHHLECRQANEIGGVALSDGRRNVITFKEK